MVSTDLSEDKDITMETTEVFGAFSVPDAGFANCASRKIYVNLKCRYPRCRNLLATQCPEKILPHASVHFQVCFHRNENHHIVGSIGPY